MRQNLTSLRRRPLQVIVTEAAEAPELAFTKAAWISCGATVR